MQLTFLQALLTLPLLTGAAPAPFEAPTPPEAAALSFNETAIEGRQFAGPACHINSQYRDKWVEYGKTRWRTVFSASGIDPATYCGFWKEGTNKQCGWDSQVDGGSWRMDISLDRGPLGDSLYWKALGDSRSWWRQAYGCTTG